MERGAPARASEIDVHAALQEEFDQCLIECASGEMQRRSESLRIGEQCCNIAST